MGDDFSVFWRNNEQTAALFYDLLARSEQDAYDDDFLASASQYPGQTYKLAVRTHEHTMRVETCEPVDEDGTVNFEQAVVGIYPRGHELDENYAVDSTELRAFFYPRARNFVRETANNGEFWPAMRKARPEWFGGSN